jgi:hypothetical protein
VVFPLKGDRGDIKVAYKWQNGRYTYEVARKLVTGSQYDVQFGDPYPRLLLRVSRRSTTRRFGTRCRPSR